MSLLYRLLARDTALYFKESGSAWATVSFFLASLTLLTFVMGPDATRMLLFPLSCGLMLLACLMALDSIFARDEADCTLEQYALLPLAPSLLAAVKIAAFALAISAPMAATAYAVHGLQHVPLSGERATALALLALSTAGVGTLASALALLGGKSYVIRSLIALPLMMPAAIFSAIPEALPLLAAYTLTIIPIAGWIGGAALRSS